MSPHTGTHTVGRPPLGASGMAHPHNGQLAVAISNAVVAELAATTGRGPTQARTTLAPNAIFVVLQDTLTRGERSLVAAGDAELVLGLRRRWQRAMQETCTEKIQELTGRTVIAFMSDNYIDPDVAVEVFILEPVTERARDEPVPPQA
jgi:uncharacterized protein YbcI